MNSWYKKMEVKYHQLWQEAVAAGDAKKASKYKTEHENYVELLKQTT